MGVLNVTPDSFSDGGRFVDPVAAVDRAARMVAEGADVIDVGGESTRPGAEPVAVDDERRRVLPVLEALADRFGGQVRLSVDTRNAEVARAAVAAGATLINDVSATLWPVAAELGVGWVAMHGCDDPRTMQDAPAYDDVVAEVCGFLAALVAVAVDAGVSDVWVDPGFGFGKDAGHNLAVLAHLDRVVALGHPVLVGTSRKSTLGVLTARSDAAGSHGAGHNSGHLVASGGGISGDDGPVAPSGVDDRLEASLATAVWAFEQGAAMVRVHDVLPTVQAARVVAGAIPPLAD
jgi:dihydropteroate synthase